MTRLSSRARLYAPRVRETARPKLFPPPTTATISDNTGNSRRHSIISARAIEILGDTGRTIAPSSYMASGGRCFMPVPASSIRRSFSPDGYARSPTRSIMPSCGPGARWRQSPTLQRTLGRSRPGCRGGIAGRVGNPRVDCGIFCLRLAGARLLEAGTAGQSPARPRSSSSMKRRAHRQVAGDRNSVRADRPRPDPSDHRSSQRGPEYRSPGACRRAARRLPSRGSRGPSCPRASPRSDGRSGRGRRRLPPQP